MRQTRARYHTGDIVTIAVDNPRDPFFAVCAGLVVRITDLIWEEDAWGYTVEPSDGSPASQVQRRWLNMVTLHDRDFVSGDPA